MLAALTATASGPFARPLSQAAEIIRPGGGATRGLVPMVETNPDVAQYMRFVVRSYSSATQPVVKILDTRGGMVNVYDPADRVLYVHITREMNPYSTPSEGGRTHRRLPVGYANRSLHTCLKGKTSHS